jgi:hypothetical protein
MIAISPETSELLAADHTMLQGGELSNGFVGFHPAISPWGCDSFGGFCTRGPNWQSNVAENPTLDCQNGA